MPSIFSCFYKKPSNTGSKTKKKKTSKLSYKQKKNKTTGRNNMQNMDNHSLSTTVSSSNDSLIDLQLDSNSIYKVPQNKNSTSLITLKLSVPPKSTSNSSPVVEISQNNSKFSLTNTELLEMLDTGRTMLYQPKDDGTSEKLWVQVLSCSDTKKMTMTKKSATGRDLKLFVPVMMGCLIMTLFCLNDRVLSSLINVNSSFEGSLNPLLIFKISVWSFIVSTTLLFLSFSEYLSTKKRRASYGAQNGDDMMDIKVIVENPLPAPVETQKKTPAVTTSPSSSKKKTLPQALEIPSGENKSRSISTLSTTDKTASTETTSNEKVDIPKRFLTVAKGDPILGRKRYESTMKWRKENRMDDIVEEPNIYYKVIKQYYPHYYHLRGKNNEPCYYENPPRFNLKKLRTTGMVMDDLVRYYALVREYMWTKIEPSEEGKSIYILDLEGMSIFDFTGEVVEFVKRTAKFTGEHYPARSATIFVVNVPSWFNIIWKVVSPIVDDVTKDKVRILRGKANILKALKKKIPIENIPPEYGGLSMPLGQSPQEKMFAEQMQRNLDENGLKPFEFS